MDMHTYRESYELLDAQLGYHIYHTHVNFIIDTRRSNSITSVIRLS